MAGALRFAWLHGFAFLLCWKKQGDVLILSQEFYGLKCWNKIQFYFTKLVILLVKQNINTS